MSSIDKEIARDITVAWLNNNKVSEEYLSKKQVAAFYESIFTAVCECKIQAKGTMQIETSTGATITATPKTGVGVTPRRMDRMSDGSSTGSIHRFT
ncbi:MAG TPA: hypothetical protein PL110_20260 [Candidatus Eremiobacteraeota bacterium]|nr:MAG: hypothetical protein BWY64_01537 [bacterium ADurb.Bin363]HPZ10435.1 hypothetical protein [Candidatus Eremiobacteraeota bacterium]